MSLNDPPRRLIVGVHKGVGDRTCKPQREGGWGVFLGGGGWLWLAAVQSTTVPSCGVLGSLRIVGRFRRTPIREYYIVLYYLSTANCNHLFPIHESTINWDDEGKGGIIVVEGNPIGERTDGQATELATKPELAGVSEGVG